MRWEFYALAQGYSNPCWRTQIFSIATIKFPQKKKNAPTRYTFCKLAAKAAVLAIVSFNRLIIITICFFLSFISRVFAIILCVSSPVERLYAEEMVTHHIQITSYIVIATSRLCRYTTRNVYLELYSQHCAVCAHAPHFLSGWHRRQIQFYSISQIKLKADE